MKKVIFLIINKILFKKDKITSSQEEEVLIYLFRINNDAKSLNYELWINAKKTNLIISLQEAKKMLSSFDYMNLLHNSESIFRVKKNILNNIIKKKKKKHRKELNIPALLGKYFEQEK